MNREELVSVMITKDEKRELVKKMAEMELETGKRTTLSSYIREFCINAHLNGNSSPPQEPVIEPSVENKDNRWDDLKL